jgi:hypothetical protein
MSGDEVKERTHRGDACRMIVRRGLTERSRQRAPLAIVDRRTIEPVDAMQRRRHLRQRPFALCRIGDRDVRDLTRRVVAREHGVGRGGPSIAPAVVLRRKAGCHRAPPRGGVAAHRVELDGIAHRTFAVSRNAELHRRSAVEIGEIEAALVELQSFERVVGAARVIVHFTTHAAQ